MACVVRYSFLLISIFLRSTSWADAMVRVTSLIEAVGNELIIQCATDKNPQDGVYMYKQEAASQNKEEIFYYYKDNTFTPKSPMYKAKVTVDGNFPNLNATFSNVNVTDTGLYWCEFNLADKITVGTVTWLWIEEQGGDKNGCPLANEDDVPLGKIFIAFISLLCIIGFVFVILKVREYCKTHHQTTL